MTAFQFFTKSCVFNYCVRSFMLNVSADMLLFEQDEYGPDERLKLQFEAISQLDEKEREAVEAMIAGVLICRRKTLANREYSASQDTGN